MENNLACAHLEISWNTNIKNGLTRGWWACKLCNVSFIPSPGEGAPAPPDLNEMVTARVSGAPAQPTNEQRRKILDGLAKAEMADGLYDREPEDVVAGTPAEARTLATAEMIRFVEQAQYICQMGSPRPCDIDELRRRAKLALPFSVKSLSTELTEAKRKREIFDAGFGGATRPAASPQPARPVKELADWIARRITLELSDAFDADLTGSKNRLAEIIEQELYLPALPSAEQVAQISWESTYSGQSIKFMSIHPKHRKEIIDNAKKWLAAIRKAMEPLPPAPAKEGDK